jgi:hypothetical protein
MNQAPLHTAHPVFNRPGWASRLAAAFAAVLTSSVLLGSVLFLFDQQSGDASLARASAPDCGGAAPGQALSAAEGSPDNKRAHQLMSSTCGMEIAASARITQRSATS